MKKLNKEKHGLDCVENEVAVKKIDLRVMQEFISKHSVNMQSMKTICEVYQAVFTSDEQNSPLAAKVFAQYETVMETKIQRGDCSLLLESQIVVKKRETRELLWIILRKQDARENTGKRGLDGITTLQVNRIGLANGIRNIPPKIRQTFFKFV